MKQKIFLCIAIGLILGFTGMAKVYAEEQTDSSAMPALTYEVHGQNYGWNQDWIASPNTAGTTGQALRAEAVKIKDDDANLQLTYRAHVQNEGWLPYVEEGQQAGTTGRALRMEALQINVGGSDAANYEIDYRVHVQNLGWTDWVVAGSGDFAGTTGRSLRMEAVEIVIIPLGEDAVNTVNITSSDTIAENASGCRFVMNIQDEGKTFAQSISDLATAQSLISLDGGFEGMTITAVDRKADQSLGLTLGGTVKGGEPGYVTLDPGALTGTDSTEFCTVAVTKPAPYFAPEFTKAENGRLYLGFTMDSADFSDNVQPSDFTFADSSGAAIDGVTVINALVPSTASQKDGVLTLTVDGAATDSDLYHAVDEATMTIAGSATNCGPLSLTFIPVGSSSSAVTELAGSTLTDNGDGTSTLTGTYRTTFTVAGGTAGNLTADDVSVTSALPEYYSLSGVTADGTSPGFQFQMGMKVDTEAGRTAESYSETLKIIPSAAQATVNADKLTGEFGKPLENTTFTLGPVMSDLTAQSSSDDFYTYSSSILSTVSDLASGNPIGAVGELLGMGTTSNGELLNHLETIEAQNIVIQNQLSNLTKDVALLSNQIAEGNAKNSFDTCYKDMRFNRGVIGAVQGADGNLITQLMAASFDTDKTKYNEIYKTFLGVVNQNTKGSEGKEINEMLADTLYLGDTITGKRVYGGVNISSSVLDDFTLVDNAKYNWEPETYADRKAFRASIGDEYLDSWLICELWIYNFQQTHKGMPNEKAYDYALTQLADQIKNVNKAMTSRKAELSPPADGTVKNLVTGQACKKDSFSNFSVWCYENIGLVNYPRDGGMDVVKARFHCDVDGLSTWTLTQMKKRAAANRTEEQGTLVYATLWDELKAMGFTPGHPSDWEVLGGTDLNKNLYQGGFDYSGKTLNIFKGTRRYNYSANYYNLGQNVGDQSSGLMTNQRIGHYHFLEWDGPKKYKRYDDSWELPLLRFGFTG